MGSESEIVRLGVIERLDLALAERFSVTIDPSPEERLVAEQGRYLSLRGVDRWRWIAGILAVRNYRVDVAELGEILEGRPSRIRREHQEHGLVRGLDRVLDLLEVRASAGRQPDGFFLLDLFEAMTAEVPRFRNNLLRKDHPWDSLMHLGYPSPRELRSILASFTPENSFRDMPAIFDAMHPVRQACRVMWRYARISPHPDLNLVMAMVALNSCLRASGYPLLMPEPEDRKSLLRLIPGPPPQRIIQFELRLLRQVEELKCDPG